jgi:hypothetical protein
VFALQNHFNRLDENVAPWRIDFTAALTISHENSAPSVTFAGFCPTLLFKDLLRVIRRAAQNASNEHTECDESLDRGARRDPLVRQFRRSA